MEDEEDLVVVVEVIEEVEAVFQEVVVEVSCTLLQAQFPLLKIVTSSQSSPLLLREILGAIVADRGVPRSR